MKTETQYPTLKRKRASLRLTGSLQKVIHTVFALYLRGYLPRCLADGIEEVPGNPLDGLCTRTFHVFAKGGLSEQLDAWIYLKSQSGMANWETYMAAYWANYGTCLDFGFGVWHVLQGNNDFNDIWDLPQGNCAGRHRLGQLQIVLLPSHGFDRLVDRGWVQFTTIQDRLDNPITRIVDFLLVQEHIKLACGSIQVESGRQFGYDREGGTLWIKTN